MALKKPLAVPRRHWAECDMEKMKTKKLQSSFHEELMCFDCHAMGNKETCGDWNKKLIFQPTKKNQSEQTKEQQITKNLRDRSTQVPSLAHFLSI